MNPYRWARGLSYYYSLYEDSDALTKPRYYLDASTDYGKLPYYDSALERIKSTLGDRVKIIYMMRDPFKRVESHHLHAAATKVELFTHPPEQTDFSLDAGVTEAAIQITRYAYHLDRFVEYFGSDNVLPLVFEEMLTNEGSELKRVTDFLGIEPLPAKLPVVNPRSHKYRNETLDRLRETKWLRNTVRTVTSPALRDGLKKALFPKRQVPGRFTLNDDEKLQIAKVLESDLKRLETDYQIDIRRWETASYLGS